jgi:mannose-1-phosphate guanylyltransferase/mannose-6-phosphate isomerase
VKAIVLAGGGGIRLWPLSTEDFPKQFLSFGSKRSLLQKTVDRLLSAPFIDEIIISTNDLYLPLVEKQLPKHVRILVEPCRRNTAPAIALAVKLLENTCKATEPILVVPSDHLIEPEAVFLNALEQVQSIEQKIITFGIRPTRPETGYGYIEIADRFNGSCFKVRRFVEKPNREKAEEYIHNPNFFWNSGIFLFTLETFWQQLALHCPDLNQFFEGSLQDAINQFKQMPHESIDYALMEKTDEIVIHPLAVSWSDVGSWDSVYEAMEKDEDRNVKIGQIITVDTKNSLIIGGKRVVSTIGLEDLLIVETEEAVLISKKGESQRVRSLLEKIRVGQM